MQEASKVVATRQAAATRAVAVAAHSGTQPAVVAACQTAADAGVPPSTIDPHRQVWHRRETGVKARSKAAAEAVPFVAAHFDAAVAEVRSSLSFVRNLCLGLACLLRFGT